MRSRTKTILATIALLPALALVGCVNEADPAPHTPAPTVSGGLPDGVTQPTALPDQIPDDPKVRARVQITECEAVEGGWRATGSTANAGDADTTYAITVFFTTDMGTVIGAGRTDVAVPADGTAQWEIVGQFGATDPTLCVLRGAGAA